MQTTIEETNGSPNKNTQQSTEIGTPNKTQENRDEEMLMHCLKLQRL
jgi:hypothetical protein